MLIISQHLMTQKTIFSTVFALVVALHPSIGADPKPDNEFTSTAEDKSKVLEVGDDFVILECAGMADYKVIFKDDQGRSWIDLSFDGKETEMMTDIFNSCPGTWPSKANDVVQWRGIRKDGEFSPYAVIFRMQSVEDESKPDKTETLVVVKLDGADSKVVGKVASNAGGNAAAEAMADKLCGPK